MTMMENQNAASLCSESFGRKEKHELVDSRMEDASAIKAKDGSKTLNCKVMVDFSMDNEIETIDSPTKEGQNGQLHHLGGWDKDGDSLSSDSYDMDKEQRSPELESSEKFAEFTDYNSCEVDTNLFTDKNVLECEVPELEVCYKEIDCQTLKDICVDEGRPDKDINVVENDGGKIDSQCQNQEENDSVKVDSQGRTQSSLDNSFEKDIDKHCDPEDMVPSGDCGAVVKAVTDSSEGNSLVDRKLPTEYSGEGNEDMQPPDQILDENPAFESPSAESVETGEVVKATSLVYNSKVESQSITFNFKPPAPNVEDNIITENVNENSADSDDLPKDVNAENLHDSPEVQEKMETSTSDDPSTDGPAQFPTNKNESSAHDPPTAEPPKHEQRNSGNVTLISQLQRDEGETSFSAASLITYSGPIAFSGSLSHRSDGSTTSGKSFAFPVLQSEWNSSPVRMAKAERRQFRKHKGWRSGLLCCRF